jgi:hypothetical protein
MVAIIVGGRVKYVPKPGVKIEPEKPVKVAKPKRVRAPKEREALTFDPRFLKQNRELRDRYLEHLAANPSAALSMASGKYDVSRALPSAIQDPRSAARLNSPKSIDTSPIPCLPDAA